MKKTNAFAISGLIAHIIVYILLIVFGAISCGFDYSEPPYKPPYSITITFVAFVVAGVCMVCYLIDAIRAIIDKRNAITIIKLILVIAAIPLWQLIWQMIFQEPIVGTVIWHVFFAILFIFEIIVLFVEYRRRRKEKRTVVEVSPLPLQNKR